ncbi:unnamed protein product (macronuclear) [Paramecium tetraurelia]|uniref:Uncharacterized protein n=1 Tax=Paramecium tetraurelia TaxID=5888 RepID=A0DSE0_PARTE|nr:uncharacterized protein GSPATT00019661001 [Paramecium tetraurelia]CAK85957.1 unnamed protein product [Paramecium tetraurelia]|eukprot:XP_001453354.1 hypothetical protein (macronuclear) [Paramecium tetraurelia strain d4-2]
MNNSTLICNPRHKQIYQIYTSRNHTQTKYTPKMHSKLPNCSPQPKINDFKVKKQKCFFSRKKQLSHHQSPVINHNHAIRDSSESFMKDLDLSGNEDLKEINKNLLLTSQEINKKMQFNIESYLNSTFKQKQLQQKVNNFIDLNFNHATSVFHYFDSSKSRRSTPLQPLRLYQKK